MHIKRFPGKPIVEHDFAANKSFEGEGSQHIEAETETCEVYERVCGGEIVEHVAEGAGSEGEESRERHEETGEHGYAGAVVGYGGEAVDGGGVEGTVD
ncbi:hypothetical protein SBOR_2474 [Sclerotinia borealis F-4128]|uniref:Uncharacterized protein n=1 Tax=Sclerotinia borealis (strain F-4128) TaxID=1432307 RepID=W9CMP2_SCLBF|nr:hypothetical protein SBOR_2474 [Sclerotinia borealis F-4128]